MRARFIAALGQAVTGVNVVTTDGPAGRFGLTVSAMASVSADPPLLLVCVNRRSPVADAVAANGHFAVNVLGAHQAALADRFAGRASGGAPYAFEPETWVLGGGPPLLPDATARFACSVASATPAGSHLVIVGAVRSATRGTAAPLAYTRGGYAHAAPLLHDAVADPAPVRAAA